MMIGPDPMMRMERMSVRRGMLGHYGVRDERRKPRSSPLLAGEDLRELRADFFALLCDVRPVAERDEQRFERHAAVARMRDPSDRSVGAVVETLRGDPPRLAEERQRAIAVAAEKLEARHEQMLARVAPITARAEQLRHTAAALERQLTGGQLGALRRARHPPCVGEAYSNPGRRRARPATTGE